MDERDGLAGLPAESPDPAAQAFTELRGELALVRRAVEHLAVEKAEIAIPDYTATLARMATALIAIEDKPALHLTPDTMAARIEAAAAQARRDDKAMLANASQQQGEAVRVLQALVRTAITSTEQTRRLWWALGLGVLLGCLLWALLPGFVVRLAPTGWHWPERLAARTVREPTLWQAGTRIMQADSPGAWAAIAAAAEMRRDNREALDACEQKAAESKKPVQCIIRIRARSGVGG